MFKGSNASAAKPAMRGPSGGLFARLRMESSVNRDDYNAGAKTLHWLIALLILVLFPLGWTMGDFTVCKNFKLTTCINLSELPC